MEDVKQQSDSLLATLLEHRGKVEVITEEIQVILFLL